MESNLNMVETRIKIREKIPLESKFLDLNVEKNLFYFLKKNKELSCTKKYGLISKIFNFKILDTEISMADSSNLFYVEYEANVFKPEVNKKYITDKTLFSQGTRILMEVGDLFQTLIINGEVEGNYYVFKTCACKIKTKPLTVQKIIIVLDDVEYKDGKIITVGKHVH
jgi:hypothetical protein